MLFAHRYTAIKLFAFIFMLSVTVRSKSINTRTIDSEKYSQNENQHRQIDVPQLEARKVETNKQNMMARTTTAIPTTEKEAYSTPASQQNEIKPNDDLRPSDLKPENITRNQRTIGEFTDPVVMIENFRKKLRYARNHLEEMSQATNKPLEPKLFINDPNMVVNVNQTPKFDFVKAEIDEKSPRNESADKKIIASPNSDLNEEPSSLISQPMNSKARSSKLPELSKDSIQREDKNEMEPSSKLNSSNNQECSVLQSTGRAPESEARKDEEMDNLLHMRGEINRLRSMMQVLKEHQIKDKLTPDSMNNRHLTKEEQSELEALVKKMKDKGLISTSPLDATNAFGRSQTFSLDQINNENSEKLSQDVNSLKEIITDLAKRTQVEKMNEENLLRLHQQLERQNTEIENLIKLVDKLLPPIKVLTNSESKLIKPPNHMNDERVRLDEELKKMQDILNHLMAIESKDKLLRATSTTELDSISEKSFDDNTKDKINEMNEKKEKSDEEMEALLKIFNSLAHPSESREGKSVKTKIEQLERELKELDSRNLRTRQEMLLEKLQRDIQELKHPKPVPETEDNIQAKIKKLEEDIKKHHEPEKPASIEDKIAALEKHMKKMTQPQSRDLDTSIEKELNKLQKEIDRLSQRNDNFLLPEHSNSSPSRDQIQNLLKNMLLNSEDGHLLPEKAAKSQYAAAGVPSVPILPVKKTDEKHIYPHIFQLPFCLQKNHEYTVPRPENHELKPYPGSHQSTAEQSTQYNVEQHSYPSKSTTTMFQPLPYHPLSTGEYNDKSSLNSVENYEDNKGSSEYSGNKPQISKAYQLPTDTESYPELSDTDYGYKSKQVRVLDEHSSQREFEDILHDNVANKSRMDIDEEITRLNGILEILDKKISKISPDQSSGDLKIRKKRSIDRNGQDNSIANMNRRLALLKERVERIQSQMQDESTTGVISTETEQKSARRAAYDYSDNFGESEGMKKLHGLKMKKIQKFDKLFIKIVKFIMHKLEISAPYIVQSLFDGEQTEYVPDDEDTSYAPENSYRSSENGNQMKFRTNGFGTAVQNVLDGFSGGGFPGFNGLLGIIPTILFKLLSNFSSFLNVLKRNSFFKNFLVPGILILLADGIMAIMVWWFSPQDDVKNIAFLTDTLFNKNKNKMSLFNPIFNNQ